MDTDITDPSFKYAPSQNPIDPLKTSGSAALPNTMAQQVDFVPSGDDFADTIAKQTRQRIADQTNAMNLAISKAAAGNADEAAAAQRLGYETGVGADIAARNMKALQERVAVDRIGQLDLMRADPVLAKMLSDQNFAAIAHDDVDNLQSTGTMLDSVMGVKNEFLLGRERGYATTALGKTGGKMLQDSWLGKPLLEADRAEARRQVAEMEKMRGSGGFAESFGALEGQMESGLPGQIEMAGVGAVAGGAILGLPSGGLGLVPGMVAGAELGFLSASAVQSFEIESGASFVDLLDQDIPEDTARTAATIVGTINAALEMIPLKFFTSRAKSLIKSTVQEQVVSSLVQVPGIKNAVGKFVKEWTMGIGVESVTEVVQELTNMWGEDFSKYQTDPDFQAKMTTPAGRMEVANRLLSTFEEVAKGMAVMGFIMPGANFALDAKRARKANKAKQFFKDIGKDAAASKVRERNPNSYQAWFAARAKGTGAETIYVDVDKVRGAMVKNGINQEQLQFLLPDLYKQLQAIGANSGVDVTIPTSVYAARLVDTAFGQDLQSDMRLNPDDMSINDNNEYVKTRDRRVAELVKLSDEMTASDEILAESAKVVENRVVAEIMAVGKYTELEAKAMAAAHVAFAVVNAPEFGMTPDQFDTQYGMATRGEGQAVPTAPLEQAAQFDQSGKRRTDTQEFRDYFGDSKVVDENNQPLEVYHGTNVREGISEFIVGPTGDFGRGIYFTTSPKTAAEYAGTQEGAQIVPVYLSLQNPLVADKTNFYTDVAAVFGESRNEFMESAALARKYDEMKLEDFVTMRLKEAGYDGVIVNVSADEKFMVAFAPEQAKSVYNRGTWSSTTPIILEQAAYRGEHTAPTNNGYAQPLNNLGGIFPDDIYSQDAARLYSTGNEQQDRQAISIIQSARGKPNQSIKIYRAVPLVLSNAEKIADIEKQKAEIQRRGYERWAKKQENPLTYDQLNAELDRLKSLPEEVAVVKPQINNGDWVTISKQYAVEHGESALNGNYKIVTKTVPVKHLFTDGNSIQEWGYDSTAQGILQQSAVVSATTYSALDKAVGEVTAKSLAAAGWKEQIKGWVNKGIVKQSEVEWSGLVEYLDMQEGKITKETVSEFLKNNGVKVETVTLGDRADMVKVAAIKGSYAAEAALGDLYNLDGTLQSQFETYRNLVRIDAPSDQIAEARIPINELLENEFGTDLDEYIRDAYESDSSETKYSRYVLPGGKNYREVLVKLPVGFAPPAPAMSKEGLAARQVVFDKYAPRLAEIEKKLKEYNRRDGDEIVVESRRQKKFAILDERSELETKRDAEANALYKIPSAPEAKPFISSHWDESNVLVHLRMNDRTDADGKRVLFIEEVQSDWGQEGKKKGFAANPITIRASEARMEELEKQIIDIRRQQAQLEVNSEQWNILEVKSEPLAQNYDDIYRRVNELKKKAIPQAPFVETTDGWLNLGLKHVMLEAINGGYDRVAFVDGDQSVTRYKDALTEAVDEVEIDRNDDGTYNYKAIKDGKEVKAEESVTAERIEDLFGKSGGADLIQQADAFPDQINTIKSEDIKIGGEGMRKFYDDVLPAALNKLLKKYGGDKLGTAKINMSGDASSNTEQPWNTDVVRKAIARGAEIYAVDKNGQESLIRNETDLQELLDSLDGDLTRGFIYGDVGGFDTQPSFNVTAAFIEKVGLGLPLFQAAPSPGRRGSFDPTRLLTTLNTKADLSTFLHESSHFFFSVYTDIASRPGAPARIAADVQILLDSFGVKDIAAWNAMTFEEQRKYQEQFAYNFEIYLFEGKAPSIEMQGLFERFSKWLRRVYTSISTELNDIYRREFGEDLPILTDEIRGVMGRMLASEAQIKRAEAVNEMKPQFQTQAESGMDDARWAAYQAMIQEAHDQAVTDLTKASLRQMEWLSNARSRLLKNMQSKHDEIRKEMRAEIEAEVMAEPLYMAMSILKTGQGRAKNGELVQFNDKFKLNLEAVKKMLPSEEIAKLGYGKYGMVSEDGIPPDMVAEIVGFVSGDELVLALLTAKPAKEEIAARLDKRMMDEYGKMNTPEAREAAVQAAIHNEARERFVAVEARFIAKATQPVRVMIDAAKAAARQIVGAKKIDDISPGEYAAAEARAFRDAAEAYKDRQTPDAASKSTYTRVYNEQIAKGVDEATAVAEATSKAADASTKAQGKADAYKAKYGDRTPEQVIIRAKQAQVLQNQLVKEATSSLEEVDTAVKDFRKFFGSDEKIAKSRNMDLVDAARAILSYYGFGKVDKNPADYIKKLEAYNPELYAEIEPLISQASTGVRDYTQMTMDDFRMLRDVVDALWAQSRRDKQITVAGKKIALDGVLSELDARLNEIGVPTTVPGEKSALTTKEKFAAHLYSAKALLRRVENWADATDGAGGVGAFTKYIYRPVKDAVNAYRVDRNNYVKRFVDLVSTLDLPVGKITSPELDYTFGVGNGGIGKAELLGAMLHTGNESNYKKLLIGRKWGEFNDDESVNTSRWDAFVGRMITEGVLTKEDFDFLQAVWDLNEEIKPIAQRAHRDLYGYYFKEVEATSFTNRFGTYRGGYVPAKTDAAIVRDAQRQAKAEELEADFRSSMPSTGMGFTKGRVEYNKPLSLDVRLMAKHIDDVLRFANIQPAIKDALRIVNNRAFADKLSSIDPTAVEFMLLPWLNRTARQSTNEPGRNKAIDNFWRTLRSRTGMSIMFANLRNALQQVTGLFPSALKVSKGALKDSLFAYLASPRKTAEAIAGLSPFMNERMHSQIFEIQDQMNDLLLNPSKFDKIQKWSQHHGYFLQSAFQNFVDIVTWNGKYNQVLSEIGTTLSDSEAQAEAIQQADAAVRSTQGSMSAEDVAAFEVGSPFYKTFVQFTGYFNMLANLNTDEYVKVLRDLGWRGNKGKLVSIYMLGFLAPTLVADAIARSLGAGWDDDDDGYLDDVADWFFGSQVRAGAAMVPFGSAAYTAFAAGFTARTYDDRITSSPSIGSLEASTVGVGKAVVNLASDDKELTGRNVRDVLTLITNATGVPVSVLGRPIGYQMEVNRGKVEPTDPIDYMRGLITGVPSAESKKK